MNDFLGFRNGSTGLGGDPRLMSVPAGATFLLRSGQTFRYGRGENLTVAGTLNATGVVFEASDATYGWGGITFMTGAGSFATTSTLSGVRVSGVRTFLPPEVYPATEEPFGAAVTVVNRSVVITGGSLIERGNAVNPGGPVPDGTVWPTNGVQVAGRSGRLTVTGLTRIQNHGGVGVLATGGGFASVTDRSNVVANDFGGVRATGYRSSIGVGGYAQVNGNFAPGIRALQQGFVSVRTAGGMLLNTSASSN